MAENQNMDLGSRVVIRPSTDPAEWKEMVRLANIDGWNESLTDLTVLFKCYPGSIFVALLDGKPVGFTAAVKWSPDVAAGGLSIVNEEYRGRGIGKALWRQRFKYVSDTKYFGVCSIAERVEPNTRLGFKTLLGRMHMMQGRVLKASLAVPRTRGDLKVTTYEDSAFDDVLAYDNTIQSIKPRPEYLKAWFAKEKTTTFVARSGDGVVGYGCIQPAPEGYRLAPLYADSDDIALLLLHSLLNSIPEDEPMILIYAVKGSDGEALGHKLKLGMLMADIAVMFTGEGFTFSWDRVYGCTGGEVSFV